MHCADGPSVHNQFYFEAADFPANLEKLWDKRFAYLQRTGLAPVVIGELGGFYAASGIDPNNNDQTWQDQQIGRAHV